MKCLALAALAFFPSILIAQPNRVVVRTNGTAELIQNVPTTNGNSILHPDNVPVFTEQSDGSLVPGATYRGISESGFHYMDYPGAVVRQSDGTYEVEMYTWSVIHGPAGRIWRHKIPGSENALIYDAVPSNPANHNRGGSSLIVVYNHSGAPLGMPESVIARSITNAVDSYRELLKDDVIFAVFEFSWINDGYDDSKDALNTIAFAEVIHSTQGYSFIRNGILNTYAANSQDTDFFENGLYNSFPLGNSIGYARPGNATDNTNAIKITWPLRTKLIGAGNNLNLQIKMNADFPGLDPDPSDGISGTDLTGTLIHELGHHLGFTSHVEILNNIFEDAITVWDIFRMNAGLGGVSPNEFSGQRRELRHLEEANAALQLNSTLWALGLSRGTTFGGDARQSSHWKDDLLSFPDPNTYFFPNDFYIGIMDPTAAGGSDIVGTSYLQPADIRAFDVMGYTIDAGDFMQVDIPVITDPTSDHVEDPALPLHLNWVPQSGTTSSDILIYDLGTTINIVPRQGTNQPPVFRADNITGGTLTITTAQLQLLPGHRYQWHAAVYNPMGVALTDPATFIAQCAAERTGDLSIDFFDISDFLADFGAMDPSADINNDGLWNFFDVSTYLQIFADGCP